MHDLELRRVRDLPLFEHRVELIVPRVRVACAQCGLKLERLGWLAPYARLTRRLAESVARLCRVAAIVHVARFFDLDWKTVKQADRVSLECSFGPVELVGITVIALDEFAIHRGHRYATEIVEPPRKRVLWVGRGRGREDIRPFFELLGVQRRQARQAAVMDMNAGYERKVQAHCPSAAVVFELFHVVAGHGREVIDRVRFDRANELRADRHGRRVIKGARWRRLKSRDHLTAGILAHCSYPLGTNLIEGINNKIKVIKRMAYGFRDDAYFFLKVRAAYPGVGR